MTSEQLREWRASGRPHVLIDVREPAEHALSSIDGAILIPLSTLTESIDRIPTGQPVVVHCRSGRRSANAVAMLRARGFDAHNLAGGILEWQKDAD